MPSRILIVDDERPVLELLMEVLEEKGFEVDVVGDGQKAVDAFRARPYDLVMAGLIRSGNSGSEFIWQIKEMDENVHVVVLAGYATLDDASRALRNCQALDFLIKPLENLDALHNIIEKALDRRRLQKENQILIQALERVNDSLEEKVESRTMELKKMNEGLRRELFERERTEEELRKAKNAAEVASRVKSDFIAAMSHELRNPLNTILGFSEILMEKYFGPLTEKQEQYVKDIHRSGQRLLMHINDILDLTSVENEKKTLVLTHVNIRDLIEGSLNFIRGKALRHGVKLEVSIADDVVDLILKIDRRKMKQVLFNLFSNAMKFTRDGGGVKVDARKIKDGQNELIAISVAEYGNGAGRQMREALFDEFFQVESGGCDEAFSSNPDFSLCKRILEMHGGTLAIEREGLGKGGRFTVVLPLMR